MNPTRPSLDFNWLPMSARKGITTPRVVYLPFRPDFSGCYKRRQPIVWRDESSGLELDLSESATIVVCGEQLSGHTLAHEWRHHWQHETGRLGSQGSEFSLELDYETAIRQFFGTYPTERDALLFQHSLEPDDLSEYWMEIISK